MKIVTIYQANIEDRHILDVHGYSKSGDTETFIITAADRKNGRRLTPWVEREFDHRGLIRTVPQKPL